MGYKYLTGIDTVDQRSGGLTPGTNILVLAPGFSNGEQVASYLARPGKGEFMIVLSNEIQAEELLNDLLSADNGFNKEYIGIIDAITRSSNPSAADKVKIKYVGSPNDLTGMDIRFSQLTETIMKGGFNTEPIEIIPAPIRYCVLSLTSMLMFRKIDVIYQFLHVVSSKLKKMGFIGIYLLNNESFDPKTIAIVKQLMNIVVEVRNDDEGTSLRIQGSMGLAVNWKKFTFENGELIFIS